jgi:hypothetical protein
MAVRAIRRSDEAMPCMENRNIDVVVRSTLRALVASRWLAAPVAAFPLFLPFFPLLPFSWSWREVVATGVVAERMEGARAPRVAPTYRGRRS